MLALMHARLCYVHAPLMLTHTRTHTHAHTYTIYVHVHIHKHIHAHTVLHKGNKAYTYVKFVTESIFVFCFCRQ